MPLFDASAQSDGKGIDAQTLWNVLQTLNRTALQPKRPCAAAWTSAPVRRRIRLADKGKAISDCQTCHQRGSAGLPERDDLAGWAGGPPRGLWRQCRRAELGDSLDSVSGFYAIGGTRIKLLDILLALAILGGLGVAVGHVFLGWLFKRFGSTIPITSGTDPPAGGDGPKAA